MNDKRAEAYPGLERPLSTRKIRQWWQARSRHTQLGLKSSGVLILLLLASYLAFCGLIAQNSQSANAASVVHTTTASTTTQASVEKAKCQAVNNNPWCYNFTHGPLIKHPHSAFCRYFSCVSDFWKATRGYVVECWNGKYSHSGGVRGVCSRDKKVRRTLYS